jgi:hypothetical protein
MAERGRERRVREMKSTILAIAILSLALFLPRTVSAQPQGLGSILRQATSLDSGQTSGANYIVHTTGGLLSLQGFCELNLCQVLEPLDDGLGQVFLVAGPAAQDAQAFIGILSLLPGVSNVELDQAVALATGSATATAPPPSLVNTTPATYYNSTVWEGYVNQPATQIIGLAQTLNQFNVSGTGIIADIDTGVDPNHPALKPVLLPGYDFTRNQVGGSEMNDLPGGAPTTENACVNCTPGQVNQHSIAMVDQHSVAMVDNSQYADFWARHDGRRHPSSHCADGDAHAS